MAGYRAVVESANQFGRLFGGDYSANSVHMLPTKRRCIGLPRPLDGYQLLRLTFCLPPQKPLCCSAALPACSCSHYSTTQICAL